ncbi:MAG: xanthine dehydrogenase family protein molybdopterin-binding subunit, partial [Nitrospinota bacterium]
MVQFSVIGKPLPLMDSKEKVTGAANFVADLKIPRIREAALLRSPLAHAGILNIEKSRAERLPGVRAVLTGEDTPKNLWGQTIQEHYLLAVGKVRFIGEEVAAVVARNASTAQEALELIKVDYEPLPALLEPEDAMRPDAPQIHEGRSNVALDVDITRGDVEAGFRAAHLIHEDTYQTPYQYQAYMEPTGTVATCDVSGKVTAWSSTQVTFFTRDAIASALGLPPSKVRVIQPFVGGGFGGKLAEDPNAPITAFLAWKTGESVRLQNTRTEDFAAGRPRTRQKIALKMGLSEDGKIVAKDTRIIVDNGAYTGITNSITKTSARRMDSLYRQTNVRTRAYLVYTNKVPTGAFRGFGNPQMAFALESHLDAMAHLIGMDPKELRIRNAIQEGDTSIHGWKMGSCGLRECIQKAT